MNTKKSNLSREAITRDLNLFDQKTGNIYEALVILSKRAEQISEDLRRELEAKLQDYKSVLDTLEETIENKEQIDLVRKYEQMAKPTIIAIHEFLNNKIIYQKPEQLEPDKF